jgi:4-hydroxy-tetrahydrodipicolinate synthase
MGHFLWGYLWGSPGYFTSVGNFVPRIELDFFDHLTEGNLEEAKKTVREIEIPFMEVAVRIGWWRALKATLDIFGLPGGYSRLPSRTASQSEKEELEETVRKLGLL